MLVEVVLQKFDFEVVVEEEVEEKLMEDKLVGEKLVEDKKVDDKLIEKDVIEEQFIEVKFVEEKFMEKQFLEEKLMEEKLIEDKLDGKLVDFLFYLLILGYWDEFGIFYELGLEGFDMFEYIIGDFDDDIEVILDDIKIKNEYLGFFIGGLDLLKKIQVDGVLKIVIDDGFVDEVDFDDEELLYFMGIKLIIFGNGYYLDEEFEEKFVLLVEIGRAHV